MLKENKRRVTQLQLNDSPHCSGRVWLHVQQSTTAILDAPDETEQSFGFQIDLFESFMYSFGAMPRSYIQTSY